MSAGNVHCLPRHAVVQPDEETSNLRIVYDASSNCPSLNDCLFKGPNVTPLDILIRFWMYKVSLTSDIEQAFLNVNEEERDYLRFLWVENLSEENLRIIQYRFTRVVFGMCSSQLLLAAVVFFVFFFTHFCPGTMTTHAESINSAWTGQTSTTHKTLNTEQNQLAIRVSADN